MRRRKRKAQLVAARVEYIDPLRCASRVGYHIGVSTSGYLNGEINLTECAKEITWNLGSEYYAEDNKGTLAKIDKAIEIFTEARIQWAAAVKKHCKRRRKAK